MPHTDDVQAPTPLARSQGVRRARIVAASLLTFIGAPGASAAMNYTILDLGTLQGFVSSKTTRYGAVNTAGQVVGVSRSSSGLNHAFRTSANAAINPATDDLGTLGGGNTVANGVNDLGQVAGYSTTATGAEHAFRTTATGKVTGADLGTLGGSNSRANGINASGQVAGQSYTNGSGQDTEHAFRTTAAGKVSDVGADLGTFPGGLRSVANGINDSGQVVGFSYTANNGPSHAFRTTASGRVSDGDTDLGTLGGSVSEAWGINASGQTVGFSQVAGDASYHAFRTTAAGKISDPGTDLGTLGGAFSFAFGINTAGQVVGWSSTDAGERAFIIDATGPMRDLNDLIPVDSGWTLNEAQGINDAGQIAGFGMIGGQVHAFLLTPATPEPGGAAMALVAASAMWTRRPRRCRSLAAR